MFRVYWRLILRPHLGRLALVVGAASLATIAEVASLGLIIPLINLFSAPSLPDKLIFRTAASWISSFGITPTRNAVLVGLLVGMAVLTILRTGLLLITGYIV